MTELSSISIKTHLAKQRQYYTIFNSENSNFSYKVTLALKDSQGLIKNGEGLSFINRLP